MLLLHPTLHPRSTHMPKPADETEKKVEDEKNDEKKDDGEKKDGSDAATASGAKEQHR